MSSLRPRPSRRSTSPPHRQGHSAEWFNLRCYTRRHQTPFMVALCLMTTMVLCNCVRSTVGEDLADQAGLAPLQKAFAVNTLDDAAGYLHKYGYLTCSGVHEKHSPNSVEDPAEDRICSKTEVQQAIQTLQTKFKLKSTGNLDEITKQTMSQGRCGNSDYEENIAAQLVQTRSAPSSASQIFAQLKKTAKAKSQRLKQQQNKNATKRPGSRKTTATKASIKSRRSISESVDLESSPQSGAAGIDVTNVGVTGHTGKPSENAPDISPEIRRRTRRDISVRLLIDDKKLNFRNLRQNFTSPEGRSEFAHRSRRSSIINAQYQDQSKPLLWRLMQGRESTKIPLEEQKRVLELAFRMWSEVIPVKFEEDNRLDVKSIDILIAFAKGRHMNCGQDFDGPGGELAHASVGGQIHFDDDENYKRDDSTNSGINVLKVAVHEIGHVLGLLHNDNPQSIMYPMNIRSATYDDFELIHEDRQAIQKIYGVCKGKFDIVFDWFRKVPGAVSGYTYRFSTFFFRGDSSWQYLKKEKRTRYRDPVHIPEDWPGLPHRVDAYTQVIQYTAGVGYYADTYFFRNNLYYKYDTENYHVMAGYPRQISEDFGPKSGQNEPIPDNLDAVFYDYYNVTLYLFKGDWVWKCDPRLIGRGGCCEDKQRFTTVFPMQNTKDPNPLTGNIDIAYFTFGSKTTYFFKDETVYGGGRMGVSSWTGLRRLGPWYETGLWYDICDV